MSWRNGALRNSIGTIIDAIVELTNSMPMDGCSGAVRFDVWARDDHLPVCTQVVDDIDADLITPVWINVSRPLLSSMVEEVLLAVIVGPLAIRLVRDMDYGHWTSYRDIDLGINQQSSLIVWCKVLPLINIAFALVEPSGATQLSISVIVKVYWAVLVRDNDQKCSMRRTVLVTPVVGVLAS